MEDAALAAAKAKAADAEQGIAAVRLAVIVFNSLLYAFWIYPEGIPWLAWTIIGVASVYSVFVVARPLAFHSALVGATWTAVTDAALIIAWLTATGALQSPFWILWPISIVAVAFRFDPHISGLVAIAYVVIDAILLTVWGAWEAPEPILAVRLAYIPLFALLGVNMASANLDALRREVILDKTSKDLEASQAELRAIVDNAPSFIVRADLDGIIRYVNRVPDGMQKEDALGQSMYLFTVPEAVPVVKEAAHRVATSRASESLITQGPGPNGSQAWYQVQLAAIESGGEVQGLLLQAADVTKQREQQERAAAAAQSQAEIERLHERDAFRRDLLNAVAHELNTPLTPLRLQLEVLRRNGVEDKQVTLMRRNIDRLGRLVGDLLEVARVEAGKLPLEMGTHDAADIMDDVLATFEPAAGARGVRVRADIPSGMRVYADRGRLTQILYNLLSNAVKYAPEGSTIEIRGASGAGQCVIEVRDEGPGFNQEQLSELFQPFGIVHPAPAGEVSTGLGLYVSRELAKAHGGDLTAHSAGAGKGSQFRLEIPAS